MREFGIIESRFWDRPEVKRLSDDAQILYLYLRTCKHSTGASAYCLSRDYITLDKQWKPERITKALGELAIYPLLMHDARNDIFYFPEWWQEKRHKIANPNIAKYMAENLLMLSNCPLKARAIAELKATGWFTAAVQSVLGSWTYEPGQDVLPLTAPGQGELLPAQDPPPPKEKTKGTKITLDWLPDVEMAEYAATKGFNGAQVDQLIVRFVRYWTSPDAVDGGYKKDWGRVWKNWIDSEIERRSARPGPQQVNGGDHSGVSPEPWDQRFEQLFAKGRWMENQWGKWQDALASQPEPIRRKYAGRTPPQAAAPQVA